MRVIVRGKSVVDDVTQASTLVQRLPHWKDMYDGIADMRNALEFESPAWTYGKRKNLAKLGDDDARHVASVPAPVMSALHATIPDLFDNNGAKFYEWLKYHPEYKVAG